MRSFNCLLTCLCYSSVIRFVVHFHVCLCYFIAVPHWKNYQDFPFSKSVKSLSLSNWKWNLSTLLVLISNPCGIVHEWMLSKFMFLMVEVLILAKSILHEPVSRFVLWSAFVNTCVAGNRGCIFSENSRRIMESENWERQIFFFKLIKLWNPFSKENLMWKSNI